MEPYQEMEGRLFTASVPNLDLSTILFVVIVEAAFLAGNTRALHRIFINNHHLLGLIARDHLSYLFLQPVHSYTPVSSSYSNNHNHGRGGDTVGSLYDYNSYQEDYYYPPYNEEEFVYSYQ